jgi:hypothetical protein
LVGKGTHLFLGVREKFNFQFIAERQRRSAVTRDFDSKKI